MCRKKAARRRSRIVFGMLTSSLALVVRTGCLKIYQIEMSFPVKPGLALFDMIRFLYLTQSTYGAHIY